MSGPSVMSSDISILKLKRGEDRRIRSGHLWIFSYVIVIAATSLAGGSAGARARVLSVRDQFLGHAYVNPLALICARIMGRDAARPLDRALIESRLQTALALRERLSPEPYYRLVFGESDQLPGLVLDRYGDVLVGQIATAGMETLKGDVEAAVKAVLHPAGLFWKNDSGARDLETLTASTEVAFGSVPDELEGIVAGVLFRAPLAVGQYSCLFYVQTAYRH